MIMTVQLFNPQPGPHNAHIYAYAYTHTNVCVCHMVTTGHTGSTGTTVETTISHHRIIIININI